jgi:hypothetical protein
MDELRHYSKLSGDRDKKSGLYSNYNKILCFW